MVRNELFGWSLPPGVTTLPGEEDGGPCCVCGLDPADCVCPECPVCGEAGNPECYRGLAQFTKSHGLVRDEVQRFWAEEHDRDMEAFVRSEQAYIDEADRLWP